MLKGIKMVFRNINYFKYIYNFYPVIYRNNQIIFKFNYLARLNLNNNKRNNFHRKQNRSYHHRNQIDDVKNNDISGSNSSAGENDTNQAEEISSSVVTVATDLNDLTLNDTGSMVCHIRC